MNPFLQNLMKYILKLENPSIELIKILPRLFNPKNEFSSIKCDILDGILDFEKSNQESKFVSSKTILEYSVNLLKNVNFFAEINGFEYIHQKIQNHEQRLALESATAFVDLIINVRRKKKNHSF